MNSVESVEKLLGVDHMHIRHTIAFTVDYSKVKSLCGSPFRSAYHNTVYWNQTDKVTCSKCMKLAVKKGWLKESVLQAWSQR